MVILDEDLEYKCLKAGIKLKEDYSLTECISVSELSIVYLGMDNKRQQKCIIKEFFPNGLVLRDIDRKTVVCKQPSKKDRYLSLIEVFFNEANILKKFNLKNIPKYIDHFNENNTGYIIMEYCEGKTLETYVKEEKDVLIPLFLKNIYIPLVNAVEKLHNKGILHRDIKPTNIIIRENGVPVLIDFGSAIYYKNADKKKIFVTSGFSPLEFYSENSAQGRFSDIYALTATLYYYLCGNAPEDVSERLIEDNIQNIRKYNEEITDLFSRIIMKNLSLNSKDRLSSLKKFKIYLYYELMALKFREKFRKPEKTTG